MAWELPDTLEMPFVLSCAEAALGRGVPEIVNSDQGSHFTSERYTSRVIAAGARVSMDGRGRDVDNIFTERLWRSVKYEEVYLAEYETPREARQGLGSYFGFDHYIQPGAPAPSTRLPDARRRPRRARPAEKTDA